MADQLKWQNPMIKSEVVPKASTMPLPDNLTDLLFMAKLMEEAERYDEMVLCIRRIVKLNSELNLEERTMLALAYKNVIAPLRNAWRVITTIEACESGREKTTSMNLITNLRKHFESELSAVCEDLFQLLDTYLIPGATPGVAKVFYLKMKGDYHRYYAEIETGDTQKLAALDAYQKASEHATESLAPTDSIRLGLALNFSVFYYEIMKESKKGFQLARQAYEEAVSELETLDDDSYRESNLIVRLLRDNLNLWAEEQ